MSDPPGRHHRWLPICTALAGVAIAAVALYAWGTDVVAENPRIFVNPLGFVGGFRWEWTWRACGAIAVGGLLIAGVRLATEEIERRWYPPIVAGVYSAAWMTALGAVGGGDGFTRVLRTEHEYRAVLDEIESYSSFIDTFTERVADYPIHVKGHPPGVPLLLRFMDQIGWGQPGAEAALSVVVGASAAAAVAWILMELTDRATTASVAPLLGVAPAVVFMVTSADAVFAGVLAWTTLAAVLATRRTGGRSVALGATTGVGAGALVMCTYGAPALLIPAGVMLMAGRRVRPILAAILGGGAVVGVFAALGFWWFDGLELVRGFYAEGVGGRRPYSFFVVSNLVVTALVLGPAVIAGLANLRDRRVWMFVGTVLGALLLADLSGLSKAEVERIWLPFTSMAAIGVAGLPGDVRSVRGWLAAQLVAGLVLELTLTTPW